MHRTRALMIVAIGFLAAPVPQAWAQHSAVPPLVVPQVVPQFNDPGPQLAIPQPGNPMQQLAPMSGAGSRVYAVPRIYSVPEEPSPRVLPRHSRHHAARHRQPSRGHVSRPSEPTHPRAR